MPLLQSFPSVGQGEGGGNVNGYFNLADNLFYREDTYITPIPGDQNTIYVSLDTNKIYRYNGTIFVPLGAAGEDPQVPDLPQPSVTEVNNIYQYTGPTNNTYKNGYFYKCIFNGTDYEWVNVLVQPEGESTILTGTLLANGWSSKAQAVQIVGVDADTKGIIGMLNTATTAQLTAAASAEISVTAVGNGTVTFTCENVPSIDIPFGILIPAAGNIEASSIAPLIYSTEEREVGVWIDGKPLYQLTVELSGEVYIQANSWYTTSISNANIDNIIFANGINAEGSQFPLMANCDATGSGVNYVQIGNPRNGDIRIKTFTIQYTKTTDTAGSGSWTPSGVPAVHYSTNEQIIGTWIDGKTLYEKTYFVSSPVTNTTKTIKDASMADVAQVISMKGNYQRVTGSYNIFECLNSYESGSYNSFSRVITASPLPTLEIGVTYHITCGDTVSNLVITVQYTKSS